MEWLYAIFLGWFTAILVAVFLPIRVPRQGLFTWQEVGFRIGITIGAVLAWRVVLLIAAAITATAPDPGSSPPASASGLPGSEQHSELSCPVRIIKRAREPYCALPWPGKGGA